MIATLDERHIARGYDPYNSADQPWVMREVNLRKLNAHLGRIRDAETDAMMRQGFQHLARHGYEFFPGERRKFP